ncbi:hypothetical protein M441DRAFT_53743 [Trichoderma asperellum CBS 433.97]|uniref:Uncharacterized protein n=1 Tax=Trichoderma asperellum (strain ATCC 204424 / CBS 433.97 / NBRC 101777) TaxID=1042311 RepID=A0A2T3ZQH0_TRIA4|nr:hypothetical protein M441DRAFT_53743 [Trichoderma asperellum CBS 433.97]PTB47061.1 hypothetical protein M441DRAFT_53743 [Trichoderma asperellum CBS 433.97]
MLLNCGSGSRQVRRALLCSWLASHQYGQRRSSSIVKHSHTVPLLKPCLYDRSDTPQLHILTTGCFSRLSPYIGRDFSRLPLPLGLLFERRVGYG